MLTGLTHEVTPEITQCELTFLDRQPIDYDLAVSQHTAYMDALSRCGVNVRRISVNTSYPDSCFIEDTAIVLDEIAVVTNLGATSRQGESAAIATVLGEYRKVVLIEPPATLEGGDVLQVGKKLFVGLSSRTNKQGISALETIVKPHGYRVIPVKVRESLHLKTAVTALDDETLLSNPRWVDLAPFQGFVFLHTPREEPWGANTLRIGDYLLMPEGFPRTMEVVQKFVPIVETVDISEFQKAEGGLSCLSLLFSHQ